MSTFLSDRLIEILAEALSRWHDGRELDELFGGVGINPHGEKVSRCREYLKALPSLEALGRAIGSFMDADASEGSGTRWSSLRSTVRTALAEEGLKYSNGEIIQRVTGIPLLNFIEDEEIGKVVSSDWRQIQRAHKAKCWKCVIILCGSALEATLMDALLSHTKDQSTRSMGLAHLISKAEHENFIPRGAVNLSHSVREYRNLVHPSAQIKYGIECNQEEANIAMNVVRLVWRELSDNLRRRRAKGEPH